MTTSLTYKSITCARLTRLFMLLFYNLEFCEQVDGVNDKLLDHRNHQNVMSSVSKWWQWNNVAHQFHCKH